jgi:hypothetical protein
MALVSATFFAVLIPQQSYYPLARKPFSNLHSKG